MILTLFSMLVFGLPALINDKNLLELEEDLIAGVFNPFCARHIVSSSTHLYRIRRKLYPVMFPR